MQYMSNKIALQTFFHIEDFTYQSSIFNILSKFHSNLFSRFFFKKPKELSLQIDSSEETICLQNERNAIYEYFKDNDAKKYAARFSKIYSNI